MNKDLVASITSAVLQQVQEATRIREKSAVPVGVSNRHIHLAEKDLATLFGGEPLTKWKLLSQPGQFACDQTITLATAGGVLEHVRVLGPVRPQTQVELSPSDCIKLKINAPIRDSGELAGSPGVTLIGPRGTVILREGVIIAARHIHMHTDDAVRMGYKNGDVVRVEAAGRREVIFGKVMVRVSSAYKLECHIDVDEANAASLNNGAIVTIV